MSETATAALRPAMTRSGPLDVEALWRTCADDLYAYACTVVRDPAQHRGRRAALARPPPGVALVGAIVLLPVGLVLAGTGLLRRRAAAARRERAIGAS